ncbi:unnamed protein product [Mycena citricolor]|uniref:Expansin-like EG45 domain-containing protein n=1 Tax=Mycena citricolor TaxID=2018698 RepID=A0AAD2JX80_9AGAR|nr:unnamed protein product [Mycena citricolor]
MITFSAFLTALLLAPAVFGHKDLRLRHNTHAKSIFRRGNTGTMTWYPTTTGPDACTGKTHTDNDWYVAMDRRMYGDGSACCGKQLTLSYMGKTTTATCVDECMTCDTPTSLDLTKGLFDYLTDNSGGGDYQLTWWYGSDSGSSGSGATTTHETTTSTTSKKTTSTSKTTHTTTSTTSTTRTTSTTSAHKTTTSSTHTTTSTTSSRKPSTTSVTHPSSALSSVSKPSASGSSDVVKSTSDTVAPLALPTQGVANVGGTPVNGSAASSPASLQGALGAGSGTSAGVPLAASGKFLVALGVIAVVAVAC